MTLFTAQVLPTPGGQGTDSNALVDFNIVADNGGLTHYDASAMINEEISKETIKYIFSTLNEYKGVKKVIIESRAEYVKEDMLKVIRDVYDGVVEVGIGVESTNAICFGTSIIDFFISSTDRPYAGHSP